MILLRTGIEVDLLADIRCPVLAIQADPRLGARMTDADIDLGQKLIPDFTCITLRGTTHGLGLDTWEVSALLRNIVRFLNCL